MIINCAADFDKKRCAESAMLKSYYTNISYLSIASFLFSMNCEACFLDFNLLTPTLEKLMKFFGTGEIED